jgi:hypothetical protein
MGLGLWGLGWTVGAPEGVAPSLGYTCHSFSSYGEPTVSPSTPVSPGGRARFPGFKGQLCTSRRE